jgi:hypothetical protein
VQQLRRSPTERRRDVRQPKAFAFWVKPEHSGQRISAWMLDESAGGAAFLTAAEKAPPVGARLALAEMPTHDRLVREGAGPLPAFARVLRHDDATGLTRRVAVRFEADDRAVLGACVRRVASAVCPRLPSLPLPPPPQVLRGVRPVLA